MISKIKQKPLLENKNKMLYFWNKYTFPPLHRVVEENWNNKKKQPVVIYILHYLQM